MLEKCKKILERDNNRKVQRYLLAVLILLLPYHTMASYIIGSKVPGFKFWKELVVLLIFGLFLYDQMMDYIKNKVVYKLNRLEVFVLIFIGIEIIYILLSPNKFRAVYIGRIYFMPLLLVSPVRHMDIHTGYLKKLIMAIMGNTIILCLWGAFQALVLKDTFLINIGYEASTRWGPLMLNDEFYINSMGNFQRMTSTFAAPNTCGIYLDIVLMVILFTADRLKINKAFQLGTMGVILAGLAFTFSRTSWVAMVAGLFVYGLTMVKWTIKRVKMLAVIIVAAVMAVVILDGIFLTFDISAAMLHLVFSTFNGTDSSVNGHLTSIVESMENILRHPFGLGMGDNGPRVKIFMDEPNLTESSYFLMAYEMGIIGSVIYFASYFNTCILSIREYRKTKKKTELVFASVMLVMIFAFLSLPFIQDFDLLVYLYVIMGLQGVEIIKTNNEDDKSGIEKLDKSNDNAVDESRIEKLENNNDGAGDEGKTEKTDLEGKMQAVILAGGLGTRLRSVVNDRPKPMALINKRPFLEYLIDYLKKNNIYDIVFAVGYKGSMVEEHFKDGSDFGVKISYSYENGQLGTAGAIKNAENLLKDEFYVLNGDTYYEIDYAELKNVNKEKASIMSLVLRKVADISRYGKATIENNELTAFNEKSSEKTEGTINGGIYYMKKELLSHIPEGKVSLENEVIPGLLDKKIKIGGIINTGYFIDIGIPEDYFRFEKEIMER